MTNGENPLLVVIHGPSGVGKDSVIDELTRDAKVRRAITSTTRSPRKNEIHGVDYYFLSTSEFEKRVKNNEFIEHAKVYEDFKGLEIAELKKCIGPGGTTIIRTDLQGAIFWRNFSEEIIIILLTLEEDSLRERLLDRGSETSKQLKERLAKAQEEQAYSTLNDYVIQNNDGELKKTVSLIEEILQNESQKPEKQNLYKKLEDYVI